MQEITSITSRAKQRITLVLENNETAEFYLFYLPRQQSWFYNLTYKDLTINGAKVVLTPNALRQYKKLIPFGIGFAAQSMVEPFDITDFSTGRVSMFILNSDEVKQVESEIFNL